MNKTYMYTIRRTIGASALAALILSSSAFAEPDQKTESPARPNSYVQPRADTASGKPLGEATHVTAFSLLPSRTSQKSGLLGVTAIAGDISIDPEDYQSSFDKAAVVSTPGYLSVPLTDNKMRVDITAGDKVAVYRIIFPETDGNGYILIDVSHGGDQFLGGEIYFTDGFCIEGFGRYKDKDNGEFKVFFSSLFSEPFRKRGIWNGKKVVKKNKVKVKDGSALGVYVNFYKTHKDESFLMKIGLSEVDVKTARQNLAKEFPGWDFKQLRRESEASWK